LLSRVIAFFICLIAVILPYRLRIGFTELVGWGVQFFYATYFGIINFIIKELKAEEENNE